MKVALSRCRMKFLMDRGCLYVRELFLAANIDWKFSLVCNFVFAAFFFLILQSPGLCVSYMFIVFVGVLAIAEDREYLYLSPVRLKILLLAPEIVTLRIRWDRNWKLFVEICLGWILFHNISYILLSLLYYFTYPSESSFFFIENSNVENEMQRNSKSFYISC